MPLNVVISFEVHFRASIPLVTKLINMAIIVVSIICLVVVFVIIRRLLRKQRINKMLRANLEKQKRYRQEHQADRRWNQERVSLNRISDENRTTTTNKSRLSEKRLKDLARISMALDTNKNISAISKNKTLFALNKAQENTEEFDPIESWKRMTTIVNKSLKAKKLLQVKKKTKPKVTVLKSIAEKP